MLIRPWDAGAEFQLSASAPLARCCAFPGEGNAVVAASATTKANRVNHPARIIAIPANTL